jgi:hypothetical protein
MDPPPTGLIVHVTAVLPALATVAENCCVWPPSEIIALAGITFTATGGIKVTVAVAAAAVFAWLVAVMVIVCCVEMLVGAT